MKKFISFLLAAVLLVSAVPTALATNDYSQGTQVVYEATGSESYTITVPALLAPGGNGTVTLQGTWADNRIITVTAEPTVTLTNSIKAEDQKVLNVHFDGISEAGSNTGSQTFTEGVSVDDITNALFGTWSGKFNYNVKIDDVLKNVRDIYELNNGYMNSSGEILAEHREEYKYIRIPVNEGDEWFIWFPKNNHLSNGTGALRLEDSANELVTAINMFEQPQYYSSYSDTVPGVIVEIPSGVSYMCLKLKFGTSYDYTDSAIVANCNDIPKVAFLGDSLINVWYQDVDGSEVQVSFGHLATIASNALYSNCGLSGAGYVDYHRFNTHKIPSNADYIFVYGSSNDLYAKDSSDNYLPIGAATDVYVDGQDNTLAANMNWVYDYLENNYPDAEIAVIAPLPGRAFIPNDDTTELSINCQQYVDVMREICSLRGYQFLDLYHNSGLEPWTESHNNQYFIGDGCHPNNEGHQLVAPKVTQFVQYVLSN